MLKYLRENNPQAQIVALAVLPRGWTDAWHVYDWPSMYALGIRRINEALMGFAAQDDAMHYLDCGPAVTPDGKVSTYCHAQCVALWCLRTAACIAEVDRRLLDMISAGM